MKNQFNDSEMRAKLFLCLKIVSLLLLSSQKGNSKMNLGGQKDLNNTVSSPHLLKVSLLKICKASTGISAFPAFIHLLIFC